MKTTTLSLVVVLNLPLKPGQKLDVIALVTVPAKEPIHKLIVQREDGTPVIRYDLTGKIAALPAWAGAGAASKDTIAGIRDCVMSVAWFELGLRGLEWSEAKIDGDEEPGEGNHFLVAHLSFQSLADKVGLNFGTFDMTLATEDGQKIAKAKTITISDRETGRSIVFSTSQDWFEIRDCIRTIRQLP